MTEKLIDDAIKLGIWSADKVERKLTGMSVTHKKTALQTQISLQTKVIGVKLDSAKKIAVTKATITELKEHLQHLLQQPRSSQRKTVNIMEDPAGTGW